jgi:DNA-binding transcriptional LysR family regulator
LLAQVSLTVDALVTYPLLYCYPEACPSLEHRVAVLSKGRPPGIQHVVSFESMAMLVAAGYGLGIAAQSRITRAQAWEIRMRPFADGPYELRTHLLRPVGKCHPAAERFSRRAAQIAAIE